MILVPSKIARFMTHRVEHFSHTTGPVSVFLHELWQRQCAWPCFTNVDLVIQHTGRLRIQPAEKRRPGRPTDGVLAIGPVEDQALLGQAIEVGRFDVRIAGNADVRVQIITNDESLQLGLRLKEPIENYEFSPNHNSKTVLATLHYSTQYLAGLDTIQEMKRTNSKKGIPDGIKKWLYLTGTGITLTGLMQTDDTGLNNQSITGISLLLSTFLIDKIWQLL